MQDLEGRTAFVTGGASGIGLALAGALGDAGMNVVVADVSRANLDAAAAELDGPGFRFIELDVTDRAGWAAAADEAEKAFGGVQLLCNNAGVNIIRDVNDASFEDFDWLMSVNYGGTVNGVMTFLPRMKAQRGEAHIVNMSSIAGIEAGPGVGVYAATKFAIRGLSEAMRYDLLPHGDAAPAQARCAWRGQARLIRLSRASYCSDPASKNQGERDAADPAVLSRLLMVVGRGRPAPRADSRVAPARGRHAASRRCARAPRRPACRGRCRRGARCSRVRSGRGLPADPRSAARERGRPHDGR